MCGVRGTPSMQAWRCTHGRNHVHPLASWEAMAGCTTNTPDPHAPLHQTLLPVCTPPQNPLLSVTGSALHIQPASTLPDASQVPHTVGPPHAAMLVTQSATTDKSTTTRVEHCWHRRLQVGQAAGGPGMRAWNDPARQPEMRRSRWEPRL